MSARRKLTAEAIILSCLGAFAVVFVGHLVISVVAAARAVSQRDACRAKLHELAVAAKQYDERHGCLPGYMNVLATSDGTPVVDPQTGRPTPVSWVVQLLPELNQRPLYERWQAGRAMTEDLDTSVCPSDSVAGESQRMSFVANTGLRDLPAAILPQGNDLGMPRDWPANGLFFDNYSDDARVKPIAHERGPQVEMHMRKGSHSDWIRDPRDKTIMFTENLDATTFVFRPGDFADGNPALTEIAWGCNWELGELTNLTATPPTLTPNTDFAPNHGRTSESHGLDYKYCRPSSSHAGGFNVAFAGMNTIFVRDTLSYFIYAKLMASDDAGIKRPGSRTLAHPDLRVYGMSGCDMSEP